MLTAANNWGLPDGITYKFGYVILPHAVPGLPERVTYQGTELFAKTEHHISLISIKELVPRLVDKEGMPHDQAEQLVLGLVGRLIDEHPPEFVRYQELRHAKRESLQTIVVMCEVTNLPPINQALNDALDLPLPEQPTHVTLYTLPGGRGIGITEPEAVDRLTTLIAPGTLLDIEALLAGSDVATT